MTAEEFINKHYEGTPSCGVRFWNNELVEQYADQVSQQAVIEALENVENKIQKHLFYFDNPREWNQNDRFIQGRKKGFQNSIQTVQNEITKVRTK